MSNEEINSNTTSNYSVIPFSDYYCTKTRVELDGSCLEKDKITYTHGKALTIYLVYEVKTTTLAIVQNWKIVYLVQLV